MGVLYCQGERPVARADAHGGSNWSPSEYENEGTGRVKKLIEKADPNHPARAVMQIMTTTPGAGRAQTEEEQEDLGPQAEKIREEDTVPKEPNAYADGSLL